MRGNLSVNKHVLSTENFTEEYISFKDLFDLEEIQSLQDKIAVSYGLAAVITEPDGISITNESNFSRLCGDVIRKNPEGFKRCAASEQSLRISENKNPINKKCLNCGFWGSCARIYAGKNHIANFFFGQVNDGSITENDIRSFAEEIGANPDVAAEALKDIPVITKDKYKLISETINEFAELLSERAYRNLCLKKSIEENRGKESKYFSLIENTDGSIWSVDRNYCLITFNSAFREGFKNIYSRDPLAGDKVINKNLSDKLYALWKNYYDRALAGEKYSVEVSSDFHCRKNQGYMEYHFNPITGESGSISGVTVFGRDISARNKYFNQIKYINFINEEIHKEENLNRKIKIISDSLLDIFDAHASVLWLKGCSSNSFLSGFFVNSNQGNAGLFLDEMQYIPCGFSGDSDFIKDIENRCTDHILNAVKKSENTDYGFLYNTLENTSDLLTPGIVLKHSIRSAAGYRIHLNNSLIGYITVYSKRKILSDEIDLLKTIAEIISNTLRIHESLSALQSSENMFRHIYENVSIGIAKISMDFKIQNANDAYCRMLGYTEEELIGRHLKEITSPEIIEENLNKQQLLSKGIIDHYRMEKSFIHKNGKTVYGILDANLLRDASGNPSYFLGSVLDVTDTKIIEKQMQQNEKMKAIGHLAGGIAHDFNNILSAIIGFADVSLLDLSESSPVYSNIQQILKAGERAKNLVKQILLFSSKGNETKKNIMILPLIKETFDLLKASLPSTVNINLNIVNPVSSVFADSTKIHEIIMNLCTNSASAVQGKGTITISLYEKFIKNSIGGEHGVLSSGLYNVISVKDDGSGIPPEVMPHIFEPFYTTKDPGTGTGMGLAVVFGIVKDHGGNINVVSAPGDGAEFIVYLPSANIEKLVSEAESDEIIGGTERILFVDDEEVLGTLAEKILEKLGYSVTVFSDSVKAYEEFEKNSEQYDLMITDQTMPVLTGAELAQKILNIKKDFPVILCTGYSNLIDEEKALQAGIKGFLYKPAKKKDIANKIREVFNYQE